MKWDCQTCIEQGKQDTRNCGLPGRVVDEKREFPVIIYGAQPTKGANALEGPLVPIHKLTTCPVSYVTDESLQVVELFKLVHAFGALPESGGLNEQGAVVMQAMHICEYEFELGKAHHQLEADRKYHQENKLKGMRRE